MKKKDAPLNPSLYEKLIQYAKEKHRPFHMPGHKRQIRSEYLPESLPWAIDITEIDEFDNLHHAEGILKESMDYAAKYYGVQSSLYSVNGSTACLLSAVFASAKPGETILMGRNCHKSVYHAVFLRNLRPRYLYPQIDEKTGIDCGYLPLDLEKELTEHPEIRAVILTSPTYEGVISDIAVMAQIIHSFGIPLIVDEAHGAHLHIRNFDESISEETFSPSAVCLGGDLVIQSLHKTLPALTQTAILHISKNANPHLAKEAARYMAIFQSSSPSYVLMSSIDSCIRFLASPQGTHEMNAYYQRLMNLRKRLRKGNRIHLLEPGKSREPSKLILGAEGVSGKELYEELKNCHIQPEAYMDTYVILMTSVWDTEEMYEDLCQAVEKLDKKYAFKRCDLNLEWEKGAENFGCCKERTLQRPRQIMTPSEAILEETEEILLLDSAGRVSAEYFWLYPPGIPLLAPGEQIGCESLECILWLQERGKSLHGLKDPSGKKIEVLKALSFLEENK